MLIIIFFNKYVNSKIDRENESRGVYGFFFLYFNFIVMEIVH